MPLKFVVWFFYGLLIAGMIYYVVYWLVYR